jgi:hypothetical protein
MNKEIAILEKPLRLSMKVLIQERNAVLPIINGRLTSEGLRFLYNRSYLRMLSIFSLETYWIGTFCEVKITTDDITPYPFVQIAEFTARDSPQFSRSGI